MADAVLARILVESEAAGRHGQDDFFVLWRRLVTNVQLRTRYIRQDVFDQARAAWAKGRDSREAVSQPDGRGNKRPGGS